MAALARTGSLVWFDADVIVDCDAQLLLAPEVFLRRLHAYVSKEKLDLLQFATGQVTQTRTCAPQIVRRKVPDVTLGCKLFDHTPDHLLRDTVAPDGPGFADAAEDRPDVICAAAVQ